MKILNTDWSCWTCLYIMFPNVTGKYDLHPIFAVRMYTVYGNFNAYIAGITLISFFPSQ